MNREQLEHILRAASAIAREPDVLVIGSQSVLGSFAEGEQSCLKAGETASSNLPLRAQLQVVGYASIRMIASSLNLSQGERRTCPSLPRWSAKG